MHKLIALLTVLILTNACGMAPARSVRTDNRGVPVTLAPTYTRPPTRTPTVAPTETYTPEPTATLPPIATETPTPDASPTPVPTATQAVLTETTGAVVIVNIAFNGSGGKEPDEYVEIRNDGDQLVPITGWRLQDKAEHVFKFPEFALEPGQSCRIYTNQVHADTCGFSFRNDETAVWNNGGDCAYLLDATGVEVAKYCY